MATQRVPPEYDQSCIIIEFIIKNKILQGKNEAEEIEKLLNKNLAGKIQNLKAEFNAGMVTLTGNVNGVSQVSDKEVIKNPDLIYPGQQLRIPKA
jgi:hypothetical protein